MRSITTLIIALLLVLIDSASVQSVEQLESQSYTKEKKSQAKQQDRNRQEAEPLDFSDTGRPGQQTAGESRGGCPNLQDSLAAIVPASHDGKTITAHPSFWVYFPYSGKQIDRVEFVVQNEAREDIWRSQFPLEESIGYKSFALPQTASPLEVGQWYRWYVKVYCNSQTASAQFIQSWVKRIPFSSRLYLDLEAQTKLPHQIYGDHGIWYDAIDRLLREYHSEPGNLALEQDWQNLVKTQGVDLDRLPNVEGSYEAIK